MRRSILLLAIIPLFIGCVKKQEKMQTFSLEDVKLQPSPFLNAQKVDHKYLLELDIDRLLAPYFKEAGLEPVKDNYTNWENTGLDGHIGGHYLSALSMMYASTGNQELLNRVNYFVTQLKKCQDANGDGYLSGVPDGKRIWNEISDGKIEAGSFSLNKGWVPLYNIHKIFAGLRDAYEFAHNQEALNMLIKLSDWFMSITDHLSDEQLQQMLISEHGGMNEVFVDVAELSGDNKYLVFAKRFSDYSILNPLIDKNINLVGMHANTQIPKVIGFKRYADAAHDTTWNAASEYFWDKVINDMTISIGGNSVREHFHSPDDYSSMIKSEQGPETCNTYNMLRLSKMLFLSENDNKFMDYYERALYNHILSTQHPETGGFVYFTPMRPQHYRVYSQVHTSFWCCVGSGLENHTKYGEMIYTHTSDELFVNLFIPSQLSWKENGVVLLQETQFPYSDEINFVIQKAAKSFNLNIRIPAWLGDKSPEVIINGETAQTKKLNGYLQLQKKEWQEGDLVSVKMPMHTTIEYLPDNSNYASVSYGPIVLGSKTDTTDLDGLYADDSRMGHIAKGEMRPLEEAPAILADNRDFSDKIHPIENKPLHFWIDLKDNERLELQPFYEVHDARYMVYWPVYTKAELESEMEKLRIEEEAALALERQTIDKVAPGEQQPESDHFFKGEKTNSGIHQERFWRDATGWFSYILNDKKAEAKTLRIEYFGGDTGRKFRIELNGNLLAKVHLEGGKDGFYFVDYPLEDIKDKIKTGKIELKFVAEPGSVAGGIYGVRLMK
ncbi:glycoside hydrolase family 127 protein [Carboxylicivirga linearis]|uniref:Glycoside hydrolase family 127 protein n=1 Tax=Carboxylicivirga linearis TaxID=1628157 RepID=A0ABS5JY08_9BACT|nr:glycoside hydrolase family 127 protein [Carboxylicivirga linearis]MBS2099783.1 glycoside hydrolase family 127 protein [Carboxylicivirga linearis]